MQPVDKGAYQMVAQVLYNFLVIGYRTSLRDHLSIGLIVSQRPQRKNYLIQRCELCVLCVLVLEGHF